MLTGAATHLGKVAEAAQVGRPALLAQRFGPRLVWLVAERVASVAVGKIVEYAGCRVEVAAAEEFDCVRVVAEELLGVDAHVLGVEAQPGGTGGHEMVGRTGPGRVENGTDRGKHHREAVPGAGGVFV